MIFTLVLVLWIYLTSGCSKILGSGHITVATISVILNLRILVSQVTAGKDKMYLSHPCLPAQRAPAFVHSQALMGPPDCPNQSLDPLRQIWGQMLRSSHPLLSAMFLHCLLRVMIGMMLCYVSVSATALQIAQTPMLFVLLHCCLVRSWLRICDEHLRSSSGVVRRRALSRLRFRLRSRKRKRTPSETEGRYLEKKVSLGPMHAMTEIDLPKSPSSESRLNDASMLLADSADFCKRATIGIGSWSCANVLGGTLSIKIHITNGRVARTMHFISSAMAALC